MSINKLFLVLMFYSGSIFGDSFITYHWNQHEIARIFIKAYVECNKPLIRGMTDIKTFDQQVAPYLEKECYYQKVDIQDIEAWDSEANKDDSASVLMRLYNFYIRIEFGAGGQKIVGYKILPFKGRRWNDELGKYE